VPSRGWALAAAQGAAESTAMTGYKAYFLDVLMQVMAVESFEASDHVAARRIASTLFQGSSHLRLELWHNDQRLIRLRKPRHERLLNLVRQRPVKADTFVRTAMPALDGEGLDATGGSRLRRDHLDT
jgi:hypothetical protein